MRAVSRIALAACLVLGMMAPGGMQNTSRAQEKNSDRLKTERDLIGTWELESPKKDFPSGLRFFVEYTSDMKMVLTSSFKGEEAKKEIAYEVSSNGKKIIYPSKARGDGKKEFKGRERTKADEIVRLEGSVLILKREGQEMTFKKRNK